MNIIRNINQHGINQCGISRCSTNIISAIAILALAGCLSSSSTHEGFGRGLVPAENFSKSVHSGTVEDYSIYKMREHANASEAGSKAVNSVSEVNVIPVKNENANVVPEYTRAKYLEPTNLESKDVDANYVLTKSLNVPSPQISEVSLPPVRETLASNYANNLPSAPVGSSAPYYDRNMTANPSLWLASADSKTLFRDFRARQPMDIITIVIDESSKGQKKSDTEASSQFDILAGITNLFGIETKSWASNNASLDPTSMIQAKSSLGFEAEGETERSGSLNARISAVIMEMLPNGLLRIEGTKIVSINDEEEVLVISGLIRERDINAANQVDSSRIANMRIDFYGQGVIADQQSPGWAVKIFKMVWPF